MSHDEIESLNNLLLQKKEELKENERKQVELTHESNRLYKELFEIRDRIVKAQRSLK